MVVVTIPFLSSFLLRLVQIIGYHSTIPICNSSPFYRVKDLVFPLNVHIG
jgi:hypothetical protein